MNTRAILCCSSLSWVDSEAEDASRADFLRTTGQGPLQEKQKFGRKHAMHTKCDGLDHALKKTGCVLCSLEFGKWG